MSMSQRKNELIRGKILHYLALVYPNAVTLPLIQGELDILGYPVPADELTFHLAYLCDKGLAVLDKQSSGRSIPKVTLIRATAEGIDYYEGRLPADEGIYLEPRQ